MTARGYSERVDALLDALEAEGLDFDDPITGELAFALLDQAGIDPESK